MSFLRFLRFIYLYTLFIYLINLSIYLLNYLNYLSYPYSYLIYLYFYLSICHYLSIYPSIYLSITVYLSYLTIFLFILTYLILTIEQLYELVTCLWKALDIMDILRKFTTSKPKKTTVCSAFCSCFMLLYSYMRPYYLRCSTLYD